MAKKSGQARVLTVEQQRNLFKEILNHRHAEKNTAIMRVSFALGLRVQEIALLELKEVCTLGSMRKTLPRSFKLREILKLPASYTKGANAAREAGKYSYERKRVSFSVDEFSKVLKQVEKLALAGDKIDPELFYPDQQRRKGRARDLPMVDKDLLDALEDYLTVRLAKDLTAKPSDKLFLSQKGGPYSPNSLQNHIGLMLKEWAGVEYASSHSGRRTLLTDVIHHQGKSVKVAQNIAGHVSPATTIIYEDPPEEEVADALKNIKK